MTLCTVLVIVAAVAPGHWYQALWAPTRASSVAKVSARLLLIQLLYMNIRGFCIAICPMLSTSAARRLK